MSEAEMKKILIKINNDYYENLSKEMIVLREKYINDLKMIQTHGSHLNENLTFTYIYHLVAELSFFNDDEVLEVLSGFGITKLTTKFFQPFGEFFESLNILHKKSKFGSVASTKFNRFQTIKFKCHKINSIENQYFSYLSDSIFLKEKQKIDKCDRTYKNRLFHLSII